LQFKTQKHHQTISYKLSLTAIKLVYRLVSQVWNHVSKSTHVDLWHNSLAFQLVYCYFLSICIRTEQGHCGACRRKRQLTDTDLCPCPHNVPHCRILSSDKAEWRLISVTLCGWRRCFMADQLRVNNSSTVWYSRV